MHSSRTPRRLSTLAEMRCLATAEPHQLALAELTRSSAEVVPAPGGAPQERWEALVLTALMDHYGAHRPAETGGPYGIRRITPRAGELVVHVERSELERWARALVPVRRADGSWTGLAGLRWTVQDKGVLLHPADGAAHLVLARTFARDWHRAVAATIGAGDTMAATARDRSAETGLEQAQRTRIAPCAGTVAALLRRVMLLEPLAQQPFTGGSVEFQVAAGQLVDHTLNAARRTPPWMVLHAPRPLWPRSAPVVPARSAAEDVLAFMARYPQLPGVPLPSDAARALCLLAGVDGGPAALTAAAWALQVADRVLADPACGYLHDEGGWTANRRRVQEGFVYDSGPLDPPGAGRLIELSPVGMRDLGRESAYLPDRGVRDPITEGLDPAVLDEELTERGTQILLGLLDWALAAATHQPPEHGPWQQVTPTAATDEFPGLLPDARWTARLLLADGPVPLQLRVDQHGDTGFGYSVRPGPEGVPPHIHHATRAMRHSSAPSFTAALALAEHAGGEVAAGARHARSSDRRLLIPRPVPRDAEPHLAGLITAAAPRDAVLDLYQVANSLRSLAEYSSTSPWDSPAQGHWQGEHGDEPGTLSAQIGDDYVLAATRIGEPANTLPLNSPAYRRHLAAHQIAVDPFVETYLVAADDLPGPTPLAARHQAGLAALRACDSRALRRTDPRPGPPGEDITEIIRLFPTELDRIGAFFEHWSRQRETSEGS
jgi:hypothetical protein